MLSWPCDCPCYPQAPFNAEPYPQHLATDFLTPVHAFYKRNHGPVPTLRDHDEYRVEIAGLVPTPLLLSMADIRCDPLLPPPSLRSQQQT